MEQQEKKKEKEISRETVYLWNLFVLKQQGYPFKQDDLDLQTWLNFAVVEDVINELKAKELER